MRIGSRSSDDRAATHRHRDIQADIQTDIQTHRHTHRHIETYRQTIIRAADRLKILIRINRAIKSFNHD